MFKVGDNVKYVGPKNTNWNEWLYNRPGIIVEIRDDLYRIKYKEKYNNGEVFWLDNYKLQKTIPDYILDWEKRLDV